VETIRGIVSGNAEDHSVGTHGAPIEGARALRSEIGRILDEEFAEQPNVNP
jgi:hypothetical protein